MVDSQEHSSVESHTGVSLEPVRSVQSACVTLPLWQFKGVNVHFTLSVRGLAL